MTLPSDILRIVYVGPVPPPIGGMATFSAEFLQSRLARQCAMTLVNVDPLGKLNRCGLVRAILNPLNALALTVIFTWRVLTVRPHIAHIATNSNLGFFEKALLVLLGRCLGCKCVLHIHGGGFAAFYTRSTRGMRWLIRRSLNEAHAIIALSPPMRDELVAMGVPVERIAVLENAVAIPDCDVWESRPSLSGDAKSPFVVLFLNRVVLAKGLKELVEAARILREHRPAVHFRIVGPESQDSPAVRKMIADANVEEIVSMLPGVFGMEKDAVFKAADVYVLPSYIEAMPIGLLEGMAQGLPCIATAVGGIPGVIEDGRNGLLIPPRDAEALATAISRLAKDSALGREIGTRARQNILERFSWDRYSDRVKKLYTSLLSEGLSNQEAAES